MWRALIWVNKRRRRKDIPNFETNSYLNLIKLLALEALIISSRGLIMSGFLRDFNKAFIPARYS